MLYYVNYGIRRQAATGIRSETTAESFSIPYLDQDGRSHLYFPDFLVKYKNDPVDVQELRINLDEVKRLPIVELY